MSLYILMILVCYRVDTQVPTQSPYSLEYPDMKAIKEPYPLSQRLLNSLIRSCLYQALLGGENDMKFGSQ